MTSPPSLGYVILYVNDVAASLHFYEQAFGLARRFFNDEGGKAYGELETGPARLAFASLTLAREHVGAQVVEASPSGPPLAVEVGLVTPAVETLYERAIRAGAIPVMEPSVKPWGQTVAYVRDNAGHLVELCTPMP